MAEDGHLKTRPTLDDIPDEELNRLKERGFDWIYLLGIWQTGEESRKVSLYNQNLRKEYERILPGFEDSDICGSCFAIKEYRVNEELGGNVSLGKFRSRLHDRHMRLILDFVPNHTALDHPWIQEHPEYYVKGTETDYEKDRTKYKKYLEGKDPIFIAHGRSQYDPSWPDTFQLDYSQQSLINAMIGELSKVADLCDGVRCDMAMLVLPDVFLKTWGIEAKPFWQKAIEDVHKAHPNFTFMAEVYWDMEWRLLELGFNYAYDKRLYDRLLSKSPRDVRDHLRADLGYQKKMVRFLENHDESRAADIFSSVFFHQAAAILTFFSPGLRFFHDGQLKGQKKKISVHLCRRPKETSDIVLWYFYIRLLNCIRDHIAFRHGVWNLLECSPSRDGDRTWENFIAFTWKEIEGNLFLVAVNYAEAQGQCCIRLPFKDLKEGKYKVEEILSDTYKIILSGDDLVSPGLCLDLPPWGYHILEIEKRTENPRFVEL